MIISQHKRWRWNWDICMLMLISHFKNVRVSHVKVTWPRVHVQYATFYKTEPFELYEKRHDEYREKVVYFFQTFLLAIINYTKRVVMTAHFQWRLGSGVGFAHPFAPN